MNVNTIFLFLAISLFSPNLCSQSTINGTIEHDGITRSYIMYVPASYDPATPVPLLFCFHGYTSTSNVIFQYSDFKSIADTAGFISIYPQGELLNGEPHWNVGGFTIGSTVDDVGFVASLLDSINNTYNIDQSRVYSTGMSNGGYMSYLLACQLSEKIAAVASVTGSMSTTTFNDCNPQHTTPILQIHGTADGTVPYEGNPLWTKSIEDVLAYWANFNNCDADPTISNIDDINMTDGSTVDHVVYPNGDNCVSTELFKIYGGGHTWPGVWGNMDINGSIEVWNFLSRYDINGLIDCSTSTDEITIANDADVFPNPTYDYINIQASLEQKNFRLFSTTGSLMLSGKLISRQQAIDISSFSPGIYFLQIEKEMYKILKQ